MLSLLQQYNKRDTLGEEVTDLGRKINLHLTAIKFMPKTVKWILQPFGETAAPLSILT
jgi:hypothetical protein